MRAALVPLLCLLPLFAEPLPELMHLPGPNAVADSLALGEAHRAWVERQYLNPPWVAPMDPYWLAWRQECDECLRPWKLLRAVQEPWRPMDERRAMLWQLRKSMGEDRWWRGCLGAPVPLHRFGDKPHPVLPPFCKKAG